MRKLLVSCFVVLVLSLLSLAQQLIPPPKLPPRPTTKPWVPQELHAPYWTMEPGWHTSLEIRNNIPYKELVVKPTLRTFAGVEVELDPVTLQPEEVHTIDLEEALSKNAPHLLHSSHAYGSIVFRYTSPDEANLFAAAIVHMPGKPIDFHIDAEARLIHGWFEARSFESMWWLPTSNAEEYLVLYNSAAKPLQAELELTASSDAPNVQVIAMGPRQMRRIRVRDLFRGAPKVTFGGLSIRVKSSAEALKLAHYVVDEVHATAALLKVFERSVTEDPGTMTLRAPMIAMGKPDPVLQLREDAQLTPTVLLRNTSVNPLQIKPTVYWKAGIDNGLVSLPSFVVAAGESRLFDLAALQAAGKIAKKTEWASLAFTFEGSDNDLIAFAITTDDSGKVIAQTPFTQTLSFLYKGSGWYADDLRNSFITAGNGADQPTTASMVFYYKEGREKYEIQKRLAPGEQMWVSMNDIIRNRIPTSRAASFRLM